MGEFKDKYGKSRAGALLANLGKSDLLEKAGKALKSVANGNYFDALKSIISNDEDLDAIDRENILLAMESERQFFFAESKQITSWQKNDMASDSWLANNARPLTLLSLLANFYFIMWADSIQEGLIDVKPAYISMLEVLLMTVIVAYFGSRGFSKWDERRAKNGKEPVKLNPFERLKK
jgi:hypothetical protein